MKLCDIAQFYSPLSGGVKRYLLDKQRFLAARPGWSHVLVIPSHRNAVTRTGAATVHEIRSPRLLGSRSYRLLVAKRRILEVVEAEEPDLIEVGDPYRTAWIGLEAGRRLGIPVVAFYHSDFPRAIGRTVERFAGPWMQRLISGPVRRYLVGLYNRMAATIVSSGRLCVVLESCGIEGIVNIPLGTDVRTFSPRDSRAAVRAGLNLADDTRLLLFVGRLAREKNLRQLIAALDHLPADAPPHRLVLIGDGELGDFARAEAARRPALTVLPYFDSPERLAEMYSAADLFVHPGRYETFGIVALEAQACGTPVLTVREGGVEDTTEGDQPRWSAVDGSAPALAAAIDRFLRTGDTAENRLARRRRIERRFSTEATFTRLTALYEHLLAGGTPATFPKEPLPVHEVPRPTVSHR